MGKLKHVNWMNETLHSLNDYHSVAHEQDIKPPDCSDGQKKNPGHVRGKFPEIEYMQKFAEKEKMYEFGSKRGKQQCHLCLLFSLPH